MKKLGFGFMRLPLLPSGDFDREQICGMVDTFLERGFVYFDTAYMYHGGKSEGMLREALTARHPRESFLLADKLPTMYLKKPSDCARIFKEQLSRCGVSYFDYYLLHCLDKDNYEIAKKCGAFDFQKKLLREGKIRHMGFSFHDSPELLDRILTEHEETEFVQLQINYLDWEDARVQSRRCLETARRHGKPVIVMEPVKGGTLAKLPPNAEHLFRAYSNASAASWALRFAASREGVMMVLSGMNTLEQLKDNTETMRDFRPLSEEELRRCERVRAILTNDIKIPCTGCRYCTDGCPQHIAIPDLFAAYSKGAEKAEYSRVLEHSARAGDCVRCGSCEKHCPQHLPVRELLEEVAAKYET